MKKIILSLILALAVIFSCVFIKHPPIAVDFCKGGRNAGKNNCKRKN